jgi:hypothetical protein
VAKKHTSLMILCCLIAMGAAAAILFFDIPVNRAFFFLLILLCPLLHLVMMKFMVHGDHSHSHSADERNTHRARNPAPRQSEQ